MKANLSIVRRLSVGIGIVEPQETRVELGLNRIGTATFDVPSDRSPVVSPNQSCRLYVGTTDKFTVLMFQGVVTRIDSPRPGVTRIVARQRCGALEKDHAISLPDCTAPHVLQELVDATGIPFVTADPDDPGSTYLQTALPNYASEGPMLATLNGLGRAYGIDDAVWYEQPDGRIFWGSWGQTPMAGTPLPLPGNVIREQDPTTKAMHIPAVPSLRPGMLIQAPSAAFRIETLHLEDDTMRLGWLPGVV